MTTPTADTARTVFVLTTGTSLHANLRELQKARTATEPELNDRQKALLAADRQFHDSGIALPVDAILEVLPSPFHKEGRDEGSLEIGVDYSTRLQQVINGPIGSIDDLSALCGLAPISAELQSLFARGAPQIDSHDEVLLLASDTRAGIESGLTVATLLGGPLAFGNPGDPQPSGIGIWPDGIPSTVFRIPGLDTSRPDRFATACEGLGSSLSWAFQRAGNAGRLVLHVTGGFKVTIPFLLGLASHLPLDGPGVEAWANHDLTDRGIRVPVQRMGIDDRLQADLLGLGTGILADGRWEGYAYQKTGDGWEPTPLGRAILGFLG
jgi:hypothetical protein